MNLNALALAASIPLILGVPHIPNVIEEPQMEALDSSLLTCENGQSIEGSNMYITEITNNSEYYVSAATLDIGIRESKIVLNDYARVIAPGEKFNAKFQLPDDVQINGDLQVAGERYSSYPATCEWEDVVWLGHRELSKGGLYEYTFEMNPFNCQATCGLIYTVEIGEEHYSFYGDSLRPSNHSFIIDKEVEMETIKITNPQMLHMISVHPNSNENTKNDGLALGGFLFAVSFPFILIGVGILGAAALLITIIVVIIRSIVKASKKKRVA